MKLKESIKWERKLTILLESEMGEREIEGVRI